MKILVLNGSPKREKSDTMHVTRAFLEGMNEIGPQDVTTIHVIDKHIAYCTGCFTCMRNGGICVRDDDMREILDEILGSGLLLSFPLYGYGMPAPLKALMDRTLPLSSMEMRKTGDRYEHVGQTDSSRLVQLSDVRGVYRVVFQNGGCKFRIVDIAAHKRVSLAGNLAFIRYCHF